MVDRVRVVCILIGNSNSHWLKRSQGPNPDVLIGGMEVLAPAAGPFFWTLCGGNYFKKS